MTDRLAAPPFTLEAYNEFKRAAAMSQEEFAKVSVSMDQACDNTDHQLWREGRDYYSDSIHVTKDGGIGINCGGHVIVMALKEWHRVAQEHLHALEMNPVEVRPRPCEFCGKSVATPCDTEDKMQTCELPVWHPY